MSAHDHLLRCRSFVLRTRGAWTDTARARLDDLLTQREATGPTDETLSACVTERAEGGVYVCVGRSCGPRGLPRPAGQLPVRETACLGACRLGPSAHRVQPGGRGHTYARLNGELVEALVSGAESEALRVRRWRVGEDWPEPSLAPLAGLLGRWAGPGGFSESLGCTRTLTARWALGGRFLELDWENRWPTVIDRDERFPERLMLQPATEGEGFDVTAMDYRGGVLAMRGALDSQGALTLFDPTRPDRRRLLSLGERGLSERHERLRDGAWSPGFRALLSRVSAGAS